MVGLILLSCTADDLTIDITGEYRGAFTSDLSDIDPFDVSVVRIDENTIGIQPIDGNSFLGVTVDIEAISATQVVSQDNQQFGTTVTFNVGTQTTLTFNIDPAGFNANFTGTQL